MAEAFVPGNLVFVDTRLEDGRLLGQGERITSRGAMTVSWYAIEQPDDSHQLGDGVAYIYERERLSSQQIAAVQVPKSRGAYYWRDQAQGNGMMFVLLLPTGYTLVGPEPQPREAKVHEARIAVYWVLDTVGQADVIVRWQLAPLDGDLEETVEHLNDQFQGAAETVAVSGVYLTDDNAVRVQLRDLLVEGFNSDELDDLAFQLGVEVDDLPDGLSAKARELVTYLSRRGRLPELVAAGWQLRPNLPWP